jgi:formylglycine-generating enzyme required for sulfatase activity
LYLQKFVQIPFHLPPLVEGELKQYIESLEKTVPPEALLSEMTRMVFAHGLYPNPRQVKRALNIFRLLREIALKREEIPEEGGLQPGSVAWPLLAKTVLIQTQWPELYQEWRQRPTLVQTLEEEYTQKPTQEEEIVWGPPPSRPGEKPEIQIGGLLGPYLTNRTRYALLERTLTFPLSEEAGEGRERARFAGLSHAQMAVYIRLAGAVEAPKSLVEVPADLLEEMLSGDHARMQEALSLLEEKETERDGPMHRGLREELRNVTEDPARSGQARVSAGNTLARLEDPRFRADARYLPDEPLLGFVEIPAGPFMMGSDKERDPAAYEEELLRHKITLPTYYMSRYPVTVAQFQAFVEKTGYKQQDPDSLQGLENHPVVWVTWHDALAYCEWLTERLREWEDTPEPLASLLRKDEGNGSGWRITLPSEAEWEKAARSTDGRIYPWGDDPDPNRANYHQARNGATTAVGCFPGGASPYGCLDMAGNVWEWTRSLWRKGGEEPGFKYPYDPRDGREDLKAGDDMLRVLRGGAFYCDRRSLRCANRYRNNPGGRYRSLGFRLVLSPT